MLKMGLGCSGVLVSAVLFASPGHGAGLSFSEGARLVAPKPSVRPKGGLLAGLMAVLDRSDRIGSPPGTAAIPDRRRAGSAVLVYCGDRPSLCLIELSKMD